MLNKKIELYTFSIFSFSVFRPIFASAKLCINPHAEIELKSPKMYLDMEVQSIAIEMTKLQVRQRAGLLCLSFAQPLLPEREWGCLKSWQLTGINLILIIWYQAYAGPCFKHSLMNFNDRWQRQSSLMPPASKELHSCVHYEPLAAMWRASLCCLQSGRVHSSIQPGHSNDDPSTSVYNKS